MRPRSAGVIDTKGLGAEHSGERHIKGSEVTLAEQKAMRAPVEILPHDVDSTVQGPPGIPRVNDGHFGRAWPHRMAWFCRRLTLTVALGLGALTDSIFRKNYRHAEMGLKDIHVIRHPIDLQIKTIENRRVRIQMWRVFSLVLVALWNPTQSLWALEYTFTPIDLPVIAINDSGQMVVRNERGQFFLVSGGEFSPIDPPSPFPVGQLEVRGINNSGQIVGDIFTFGPQKTAFLKSGSSYSTISLPIPNTSVTRASDINNNGQILGTYSGPSGGHGFLSDGNTVVTIEHPFPNDPRAGGDFGLAGVNDADEILGIYNLLAPGGGTGRGGQGFLIHDGIASQINVSLPDLQFYLVTGINNAGQIVGIYNDEHGFVLDNGIATSLDAPFPDVRETQVLGINNLGQIVGGYRDSTGGHGFIATPILEAASIPEPASLLLVGAGLFALFFTVVAKKKTSC